MPSPFPGMDPYLESRWRDVHARLILYSSDAIQEQLPAELRAWVEERVVLETPEGIGEGIYPDVRVIEYPPTQAGPASIVVSSVAEAEPLIVDAEPESLTEGYIQIIDTSSGNAVVTIVEILSPTNKLPGEGRTNYLRKQHELRGSTTNLVEIDLIRQGVHTAAVPMSRIPRHRRAPYLACVRRASNPKKAEIYPLPLQEPLRTINIPLRARDDDVRLDLQAMIRLVYLRGRYDGIFDYGKDPSPPLAPADARWAEQWLRDKGYRQPTAIVQSRSRAKRRKPPASPP